MPSPTSWAEQPDGQERHVLAANQPECLALRKVKCRLSWKFQRFATRKAMVEKTWYQRMLKSVSGRPSDDAVLVGPELVEQDDHQQVHEDAGAADQAEPEQEDPVVAVADEEEVPQALHDRTRIPAPPVPRQPAGRAARASAGAALSRA